MEENQKQAKNENIKDGAKPKEKTKKKGKTKNKSMMVAMAAALVIMILAGTGLLFAIDSAVADFLYNREEATDGIVTVVGIDQRALEELGPFPWGRDVMADTIELLNADPEARPAAIAIDVVYAGYTSDFADDRLLEAVSSADNVVLAGAATFGSEIVDGEGEEDFYVDTYAVLAWDEPFEELREEARVGHINAMYDDDGVIRHMMLWADIPEIGRVYSFSREIYETYAKNVGIEPHPLPETDARGRTYLPYTSKPGGFYENVSVIDVLTGEVEGSYFADRIVLIGPYDAALQDNYRTSIDKSQNMYGIEIQANAIQSFLEDKWVSEVGDTIQLVLLFVLLVLCAYLFDRRGLARVLVIWILLCPGWLGICILARGQGYLLHPLWIPLGVTVLALVSIVSNYIFAAMEKRRVTQVFQRYVDPSVVQTLLLSDEESLGLAGKLTNIAVLFVDIRGFTPLSESLSPQEVVEILNEYLSLTTECVMGNQGTLDKFIGDCTMAFWNAPLPQDDYVYKACKAAMDMVHGSKALGDELERRFGRRVDFGIGVHTGPAVVGNIGAPQRKDFTAIGDTVNTSARLEANAPANTVYISRAVADVLGDRCTVTSLGGSIKLKGKTEGFEVLKLETLD